VVAALDRQIASDRTELPELVESFVSPENAEARKRYETKEHLESFEAFDSLLESRMKLSEEVQGACHSMLQSEQSQRKEAEDEGFRLDEACARWFANDTHGNIILVNDPTIIVTSRPVEKDDMAYDPVAPASAAFSEIDTGDDDADPDADSRGEPQQKKQRLF